MADLADQAGRGEVPFATWLRYAREEAGWPKIAATEVLKSKGIQWRTYFRWESGAIAKPDPAEIRKVCLCLGIDPREAAIAQGIITREELKLPPFEPVPYRLRPIVSVVRDRRIPEDVKEDLLHIVDAALDFLLKQLGVKRPPVEPSATERNKGKPVRR